MRTAMFALACIAAAVVLCGCPPKYTVQRDVVRPPDMPEGVIPEITAITGLAKTIPASSAPVVYEKLKEALAAEKISIPSSKKRHLALKITIDCALRGKVTRGPLKLDSYLTTIRIRLENETDNGAKVLPPAQIIIDRYFADPQMPHPETIGPENVRIEKNSIIITNEDADYKTEAAMIRSVENAMNVAIPLSTAFARANVPMARVAKQPKIKAQ